MQDLGSLNNTTKKKRKKRKRNERKGKEGDSTSRAQSRKQLASRKRKFLKIHMRTAKCLSEKSNVTRRKKKKPFGAIGSQGNSHPKLSRLC